MPFLVESAALLAVSATTAVPGWNGAHAESMVERVTMTRAFFNGIPDKTAIFLILRPTGALCGVQMRIVRCLIHPVLFLIVC